MPLRRESTRAPREWEYQDPHDPNMDSYCHGVRMIYYRTNDGRLYSAAARCDLPHPHQYASARPVGSSGPWQQRENYRNLASERDTRRWIEKRGGEVLASSSFENAAETESALRKDLTLPPAQPAPRKENP